VKPKLIPIPEADLRPKKDGWPQPGEFSIRNSGTTPNLWEVVRKQDSVVYAYLEWNQGKRVLRIYRAEPYDRIPAKQFGAKERIPAGPNGQQFERLDRRGNRFLSYCHLIQLNKKTFISMGLNQAPSQSGLGRKTAGILMRRKNATDQNVEPDTELLNHMADFRLVSKPSTWSIKLDKVYISNGNDADAYKAVPEKAFAGTAISTQTANGVEYIGLKCKYTNYEIQVKFNPVIAEIQLGQSGDFDLLEELMNKQTAVKVLEDRLEEAKKKPQGTFDQMRARDIEMKSVKVVRKEKKRALDDFITKNMTLVDLRDDPSTTADLLNYYRSIKATKGLAVSLEISRQQTIDGQDVKIPFWYPVIP
jgi:hypothetical protein